MAALEVRTSPRWVIMILPNLEGLVLMILIPRLRVLSPSQLGLKLKRMIKRKSIPWMILTQFQAVIQTRIVTTLKSLESVKRDKRNSIKRRPNRTDSRKPQKRLLLHLQLEAQEWHQKPTELSTPMSQLHRSNNLQLLLNPTMIINSLTSSAVRNLLNSNLLRSGL